MVAPSKPPSFMKGLFDSALGDVMSNIISDLGHELSDDVLNTRATRAFRAFDTDGSGRLEFHELLRAMDTLPHSCRPAREADARALFRRFDTDASGALDADEFTRLVRCLRSRARLDRMPGVIFCGGTPNSPRGYSTPSRTSRGQRWREPSPSPHGPRTTEIPGGTKE